MTDALSIAQSGLVAQKQSLAATANNIANALTPNASSPEVSSVSGDDPSATAPAVYRPLNAVFSSIPGGGVRADVVEDQSGAGVDLAANIVNLKITETAYKANLATIRAQDRMQGDLLDIMS